MAIDESKVKELRKTIPFKWRVQQELKGNKPQLIMIAYVDARDVAEHLDNIIGALNWCDKYQEIKNITYCSIGIKHENEWIFKSDCGTASKTEKEKGESSDAFKRAAVKWGINRDAYRVGTVKIDCKEYNGKMYPCLPNGDFLKGNKLYEYCNKIAKVEDLENYDIEITNELLDEIELLFAKNKIKMETSQVEQIKRIIEKKEQSSYKKAIKILQSI